MVPSNFREEYKTWPIHIRYGILGFLPLETEKSDAMREADTLSFQNQYMDTSHHKYLIVKNKKVKSGAKRKKGRCVFCPDLCACSWITLNRDVRNDFVSEEGPIWN